MTKRFLSTLVVVASMATIGGRAEAGLVAFSDVPSFSSATTGLTHVAIPSDDRTIGGGSVSVTYGGVTYSTNASLGNGFLYNVSATVDVPVLSYQYNTNGVSNILISLAGPVTAFSLNFDTFNGGAVTFTLSNGDSFTRATSKATGYVASDYIGLTDTKSFTSVLVTSGDSGLNLNNVSFGSAITPVPEPSSLALCGIAGLAGLGYARARRKPVTA